MAAVGVLRCVECGRETTVLERGWRAFVTVGDQGDVADVVVYCPDCARREFDDDPA